MNAYELAEKLEWHWDNDCRSPAISKSADMLRQQADRIAELEKQTKPLSDEEVRQIQAQCHLGNVGYDTFLMRFARIIELRHGIK